MIALADIEAAREELTYLAANLPVRVVAQALGAALCRRPFRMSRELLVGLAGSIIRAHPERQRAAVAESLAETILYMGLPPEQPIASMAGLMAAEA